MELVKPNNVKSFSNKPMYKRMLKKVDMDLGLNGSIENAFLLTETCGMDASAILLEEKQFLSAIDRDYETIYKSANTYICYEAIDKVIEITVIKFDENYSDIDRNRSSWQNTKVDHMFSKMLYVQAWDFCPIIDDLILYLDKLYEIGFRLVRNDRLVDNFKTFYVNLDDILICIEVDYNAITSIAEMSAMAAPDDDFRGD